MPYALNNDRLHIVLACNIRSKFIGDFLVGHVIDSNVASLGCEFLG